MYQIWTSYLYIKIYILLGFDMVTLFQRISVDFDIKHDPSNGLTFEILIQISWNFQGRCRNTWKECLQNFMEIDLELTEKSAENTQRWWKVTATIVYQLGKVSELV